MQVYTHYQGIIHLVSIHTRGVGVTEMHMHVQKGDGGFLFDVCTQIKILLSLRNSSESFLYPKEDKICPLILLKFAFFVFLVNWDSLLARCGNKRKRTTKRLKHTGSLFRKNLQLTVVC